MSRSWIGRKHKEYWQSICTKGRQRAFLQDPLLKAFKNYSTSAEPELGIIMGLLTGHCHLKEHLFEVGLDVIGMNRQLKQPCIVAVRL
jgi:hypothetical protein